MPGAPASSLRTGSHEPALNPGWEITAPDCGAVALLATRQPPDPRLTTSLAPVSEGAASRAVARLIRVAMPRPGRAALARVLPAWPVPAWPVPAWLALAGTAWAGPPGSTAGRTARTAAAVAMSALEPRLLDRIAALLPAADPPRSGRVPRAAFGSSRGTPLVCLVSKLNEPPVKRPGGSVP